MGTARDPVVGSGDWPAWTASVSKWRVSSGIVDSFVPLWLAGGWGRECESCDRVAPEPKSQRPESSWGIRAVWFRESVRLAHSPLKSHTDRSDRKSVV